MYNYIHIGVDATNESYNNKMDTTKPEKYKLVARPRAQKNQIYGRACPPLRVINNPPSGSEPSFGGNYNLFLKEQFILLFLF